MSNALRVTLPNVNGIEEWQIEGIEFDTLYPGGLFGSCAFFLPQALQTSVGKLLNQKVIIYNGLKTVWEGALTSVNVSSRDGKEGHECLGLGYWGNTLMTRKWRKWWADTRLEADVWTEPPTVYGAGDVTFLQKVNLDRMNRLRFTPKAVAFVTNQYHRVLYTSPTGETVKRLTFNYDLQEGVQQWTLSLENVTAAASPWTVNTSGTGAVDHTLATPSNSVFFYFRADANQTPASDGSIYGEISNLTVYSETGTITLTEIAKDCQGGLSAVLSADASLIGTDTLSLVPYLSEVNSHADILTTAAKYGDATNNAWAVGVRESALASDDKPILFAEAQPVLTTYDYALRADEENIASALTVERNLDDLRNWIAVQYRSADGLTKYVTPDDDATLQDATSISSYGQREEWLTLDTTSLTTATAYGKRVLAMRKDPQWKVSGDIQVIGYIRARAGNLIAASEIRAGKRLRIENFLDDLSGDGLTFLITGTRYTDEGETCAITVGKPDIAEGFGKESALQAPKRYLGDAPLPLPPMADW